MISNRHCWSPEAPQKLWKSHWCVPFTATFSKRRNIGASWSERCDVHMTLLSQFWIIHCLMHYWLQHFHTDDDQSLQWLWMLLPQRVCCPQRCAMPVQHAKVSEQAQENASPDKNICDKQVSSWRHISCHTDKNRYYTWSYPKGREGMYLPMSQEVWMIN